MPYSGGDGSSGNPYLIKTASDLVTLSNTSAHWVSGIYFKQIANIDMSSVSDYIN